MRILLTMGKGGVGKTTVSAATAVTAADRGVRTLVVSTDAAHSLADVLDHPLGPEPVALAHNLDGLHLEGRCELERSWGAIAAYVRRVLGQTELDSIHAEELLVVPGLDQLLALARLRALVEGGRWDAVVVDCAPSADSLRLLGLPDVLGFYMDRLFGRGGVLGGWTRRRLERALDLPLPDDHVLGSMHDLAGEIARIGGFLGAADTTARIVVTPERVVVAEGQRTLTYLSLYGYDTDAVVVNRVLGDAMAGEPCMAHWVAAQRTQLDEIDRVFDPVPRLRVSHRGGEPLGLDALREIGRELYPEADPLARFCAPGGLEVRADGAESVLRVPARGVDRGSVGLERRGDDLLLTLADYRRTIRLPESLTGRPVLRAGLVEGHLEVVFGAGRG